MNNSGLKRKIFIVIGITFLIIFLINIYRWTPTTKDPEEVEIGSNDTSSKKHLLANKVENKKLDFSSQGRNVDASRKNAATSPNALSTLQGPAKIKTQIIKKGNKGNHQPNHNPPAGAVSAEIIEGWVVTQSDIVLGVPGKDMDEHAQDGPFYVKPEVGTLWPTSRIPYLIDGRVVNKERIERAIAYFNKYTPIRFVPFKNDPSINNNDVSKNDASKSDSLNHDPSKESSAGNAIVFLPSQEMCGSVLGMVGGLQPIFLKDQCTTQDILHEILHALGFIHEQSRADRDNFVQILWDNIEEDKQLQFEKMPGELGELPTKRRFPFDYQSIMLYEDEAFAKEHGMKSLRSKNKIPLNPSKEGLSKEDLRRVMAVYGNMNKSPSSNPNPNPSVH